MKIERFEDIEIWQEARELCKIVFRITSSDRFTKDYKFTNQIRASAGSIMDNIAEGFERGGNKEFSQFLFIAKGSCGECRSQIHRALDFQYLTTDEHKLMIEKTTALSKRISAFINYLKQSDFKGPKHH